MSELLEQFFWTTFPQISCGLWLNLFQCNRKVSFIFLYPLYLLKVLLDSLRIKYSYNLMQNISRKIEFYFQRLVLGECYSDSFLLHISVVSQINTEAPILLQSNVQFVT